jgi:protein-S-isoprenylcysteine O-methyltransferase Ste14
VYLLLTLAATAALHYTLPLSHVLTGWASDLVGIAIIVGGVMISATGAGTFKKAGTAVRPFEPATALVRSGLYRYSRNPMYIGMLLVTLGTSIAFGTASAFVPPLVFFLILRSQFVLPEEQFLETTFGEAYTRYKEQVRRWV